MKHTLIILAVIAAAAISGCDVNCFAQKISEASSEHGLIQWNVYNDANERMLLWFEEDTVIQKLPVWGKIRNHFFVHRGDFSLYDIINEYGSTLFGFRHDLFRFDTFYKIIEPQKSFTIHVACDDNDMIKSLRRMIVTVTPAQIDVERFKIFKHPNLELPSFKPDTLVIDGQYLQQNIPHKNNK
jgi:hypothetical protein